MLGFGMTGICGLMVVGGTYECCMDSVLGLLIAGFLSGTFGLMAETS